MQKFALTADISTKVAGGLLFCVHPVYMVYFSFASQLESKLYLPGPLSVVTDRTKLSDLLISLTDEEQCSHNVEQGCVG